VVLPKTPLMGLRSDCMKVHDEDYSKKRVVCTKLDIYLVSLGEMIFI